MTTGHLVFEALIEEIPARVQRSAAQQFQAYIEAALSREFGCLEGIDIDCDCGPRRLWLTASGLAETLPQRTHEQRGPREGAPEVALAGFAKSHGAKVSDCELKETKKGRFWFLTIREGGGPSHALLSSLLIDALMSLNWPTSMIWAGPALRFTRPLRRLLGVFNGKPLSGGLDLGERLKLPFTNETFGHRIHGADLSGVAKPIVIRTATDYHSALKDAGVYTRSLERQKLILDGLQTLCAESGYHLEEDKSLLAEVAGLCECPVPFLGEIEPEFLNLPEEVLITSMKVHQKFFAVRNTEGLLAPVFAAVANLKADDNGEKIRSGARRVLRARLSDAVFFWEQDQKRGLEDMANGLCRVTFYAKLGSMSERVERIETLARAFAPHVNANPDAAGLAARLCKADLLSHMVGEFPELQGKMGMHFAHMEGLDTDIATAIADHYAPAGPSDRCPSAPVSIALCLAEKVELLSGFFGIGEPPTGSRDPFALRRAALGLIRLALENALNVTLNDLFAHVSESEVKANLIEFMLERLRIRLKSEGAEPELLRAALGSRTFNNSADTSLPILSHRVVLLQNFLSGSAGSDLLIAYRRGRSILSIEAERDGIEHFNPDDLNETLLHQPEEKNLATACKTVGHDIAVSLSQGTEQGDAAALNALSRLRTPVDQFFDAVTINDPELRYNRLRILAHLVGLFDRVADFSAIPSDWPREGQGESQRDES